ncbi:MAG: GNAT family N-acetyltransferase [Ignavibacteriaceae bacterium]
MTFDSIEIKKLSLQLAPALSEALLSEKPKYLQYFTPFEFSVESITHILDQAIKDKYFGIFVDNELAGFYMLRGLDEGYDTPSYGVWISSKYSNKGLSKLTLFHSFSFCRLNNIKSVMLKVHPDNIIAKNLYEALGFVKTGTDYKNNNYIYHKTLSK